jgi:hypothetical protein
VTLFCQKLPTNSVEDPLFIVNVSAAESPSPMNLTVEPLACVITPAPALFVVLVVIVPLLVKVASTELVKVPVPI